MSSSLRAQLLDAYQNDRCAMVMALARPVMAAFPDDVHVLIRIGAICSVFAQYDRAKELLERALQLAPDDKRYIVLSQLGNLCKQRGDFATAAQYYESATRLASEEADNYIFLGAMLARLGRLSEAEAAHRAATQCREGCIDEAYMNLGLVLRAQSRLVEARHCFEKALAIDPAYEAAQEALDDVVGALEVLESVGNGET